MRGKFGGLKTLILNRNPCAYYVHCFAHQLQLALVAAARGHLEVHWLLERVSMVVNIIGASNKRHDMLRDKQKAYLAKELADGVLTTGTGLNQETNLARPGDTRWGSHFKTCICFDHGHA